MNSKLILILWLDEEDWIKSMYIEYITYNFSVAIGPHIYDSWNITKQKKFENLMQCPSIKSPLLWNDSFFFFFKHFFNGISSKNFQFLNCPRINWCISISYIIKKIHPRIPSTTLILKYIFRISNFLMGIILSWIYSICSNFSIPVEFFKIID